MSNSANLKTEKIENDTDAILTLAAIFLGAAAGAKLADDTIGGTGLPLVLAQIGGALLGGCGGKALADVIRKEVSAPKMPYR